MLGLSKPVEELWGSEKWRGRGREGRVAQPEMFKAENVLNCLAGQPYEAHTLRLATPLVPTPLQEGRGTASGRGK